MEVWKGIRYLQPSEVIRPDQACVAVMGGGGRHVSDSTMAMLGRRGHSAPRVQGCWNGAFCPLPSALCPSSVVLFFPSIPQIFIESLL